MKALQQLKPLIVAVDDEIEILKNYDIIFGERFEVKSFDHPHKFLQALEQKQLEHIYVLLADLKMPGLDGIDMVRKARAMGSEFPFILLSGHLDKKAILDATDLGAFRLITKPPSFDYLINTVEQLIIEHDIAEVQKEIYQGLKELKKVLNSEHSSNPAHPIIEHVESRIQKLIESETQLRELRKMALTKPNTI